jgi:hypothetical protein
MRRLILTLVLAIGLLAVPAMRASAAVTCSFAGGVVTVTMSANGDLIFINRQNGGDNIEFTAPGPTTVTCSGGTPTVNNANTINVNDTSGTGSTFVSISLVGGPFVPGATDEPGNSDEIEFNLSFGGGSSDQLTLYGAYVSDRWAFGTGGINLNAAEASGVDSDITYSGLESTNQITASGNDRIDGSGGAGTGAPFAIKLQVQAAEGNDRITGGTADDFIDADATSAFDDIVDGGAGRDQLSYRFAESGVLLDLSRGIGGRAAGADTIDRIEELRGSDFADLLIGNGAPNNLIGADGNDRLQPVGAGSTGPRDSASGGNGLDTVVYSNERRGVNLDLASTASGCPQTATGPSIGIDCLSGIERATGGQRGDQLLGDASPNVLTGGPGQDEARGRAGPDILRGKADDDKLFGEEGEDTLDGGKERDRCVGGPDPDTFTRCERTVQ